MSELDAMTRKLRVCFFIPDFDYGGAQKQCILLLNELQCRDDVELTLVRFRPGAQDHLLCTSRLRTECVTVRSNFDPRAIIGVVRLMSHSQADVIVSWVRVCDVYSFFVRAFHPRTKWVMTQRNSRHADSWLFRLRDRLGRRADAIAANSPGGVQWWMQRNARGPVYLVDNIAAPMPIAQSQAASSNVLFVGRLQPQKNVVTMARALALVARARPKLTVWICGDGELRREMERIVAEAGVAERIQFLGFRTDATEWMSRAKVLVSLSDHEGMPNVLMEGVQAGCVIVASAIAEHVGLLGAGYPFLVQDHHDVERSAETILSALASTSVSDDQTHARQRLARMEPATVAAQYMGIFRDVTTFLPIESRRG
jgi:glycosyltransferase involved in cell wall biosynthesis